VDVASKILYVKPTTEKVAEGVWCVGGLSVANVSVIEGADGLIVYDTGDNEEEGKHFREAIQEISDKPVKAIIYSHSHYAGGGALVDDPNDVLVIGHPKLNETVENMVQSGGAPSAIPEIGPVLAARGLIQFNNFLPTEGPDAALAGKIEGGKPTAFLPVNKTVEDGEEVEVLGVKLQFFTKYTSDDYNLTVWVPDRKVALNNFFGPATPNIYTLRGGVYRNPLIWRDGLKVIRDLEPEVLLNTHTRAIVGKEEVARRLTGYMDQISLTYDQTLRGILRGMSLRELRDAVYLPPHLREIPENAQSYGETVHFPEAIYQYAIGWFDGDVTKLYRVPPKEEAKRLVELMGGSAKVLAAAKAALQAEDYAWGIQLVQYVYLLEPTSHEVRKLKADLLRARGYLTTGSIARAFMLSEARALEGKVDLPLLVPPLPKTVAASPAQFVDYFRVRIDPRSAQDTDRVLHFVFTDREDETVGLHIRRGVAEYLPTPSTYHRQADCVVELSSDSWAGLYLGTTDIEKAIQAGDVKVSKGQTGEVEQLFGLFDKFQTGRSD